MRYVLFLSLCLLFIGGCSSGSGSGSGSGFDSSASSPDSSDKVTEGGSNLDTLSVEERQEPLLYYPFDDDFFNKAPDPFLSFQTLNYYANEPGNGYRLVPGKKNQAVEIIPGRGGFMQISKKKIEYTGNMTIAFWFSFFRSSLASDILFAMSNMRIEVQTGEIDYTIPSRKYGKIRVFYIKSSGSNYFNSSVRPVLNQWYHVAIVFKNREQKLYVNGVAQGSFKPSGSSFVPGFYHGYLSNDASYFASSTELSLDEFYLYNRALSESEIQDLTDL